MAIEGTREERTIQAVREQENECQTILKLLEAERPFQKEIMTSHALLKSKLGKCHLVSDDIHSDKVVRLGKIVSFKTSFGSKFGMQLVMPDEEYGDTRSKFSILSPLGCALYGQKAGDIVKWHFKEFVADVELTSVESPF